MVKFCDLLSLSHSADDNAHILGLDAEDELLETIALAAAFNFGRDGYLVAKGNQHEKTPGKRNFATEARPFGRDRFLDDLHKDFMSLSQCVLNASFFLENGHTVDLGERNDAASAISNQLKVLLHGMEIVA